MVAPAQGIPIPKRPKGWGQQQPALPSVQPNDIVYVEWLDTVTTTGWCSPAAIAKVGEPSHCRSVGFMVKETDVTITLALNSSITPEAWPFGELVTIPKSAITLRIPITPRYSKGP